MMPGSYWTLAMEERHEAALSCPHPCERRWEDSEVHEEDPGTASAIVFR